MPTPFSRWIIYIAVAAAQFPGIPQIPGGKEMFLGPSSMAHADGFINRMGRWAGYGWSSGYHACQDDGFRVRDGLPPVSNTAEARQRLGNYSFELAAPAHLVSRQSTYSTLPTGHHGMVETVYESIPLDESWQSGATILTSPPLSKPNQTVPRVKSPREPISPSDMETLPKPEGLKQPVNNYKKTDSARSNTAPPMPTRLPSTVR